MEKRLSEFNIGEKGVIKYVYGEGKIRRRLFDMGLTPGAYVSLRKKKVQKEQKLKLLR